MSKANKIWNEYRESYDHFNANVQDIKQRAKYIKEEDWMLMDRIIDEHKIKTILEFGSGLSTALFAFKQCHVSSYETNPGYLVFVMKWFDKVGFPIENYVAFHLWKKKVIPELNKTFDACLVDGAGDRLNELLMGMKCARILFLHDYSQWSQERFPFLRELPELGTTKHLKVKLNEPFDYSSRVHEHGHKPNDEVLKT